MTDATFPLCRRIARLAILCVLFALATAARAGEREVSAADVNGTYQSGASEIRVLALGEGKLKVQLALVYEYKTPAGPMANVGNATGEATLEGDEATFVPEDFTECKITMTFLPNHKLKVEQEGDECGFGHNVRADGTFKRIKSGKPTFEEE